MDWAFFGVFIDMVPKYRILTAFCCLLFIACKEKNSGEFLLKPPPGSTYKLTVQLEELGNDDTDTLAFISNQIREFTLQTRQADSPYNFNFIIDHIKSIQPGTEMVSGKKGEFMVRPTGKLKTLSSEQAADIEPEDTLWFNHIPRIIRDSIQVTINRAGEVKAMTGYDTIRSKILAVTHEDPRNAGPLLRDYIGPKVFTDLINQLFFYLPVRKIKPGDQWVKNIVLIEKAPVKYSHNIWVESIKGDTVALFVNTVVSSRMGGEGKLILEGELSGKITASYRTGMFFNIDLNENSVTHTDYDDRKTIRHIRGTMHQVAK